MKLVPIPNRASDFATRLLVYMIVLFNLSKIDLYLKGKNDISAILHHLWITLHISAFYVVVASASSNSIVVFYWSICFVAEGTATGICVLWCETLTY